MYAFISVQKLQTESDFLVFFVKFTWKKKTLSIAQRYIKMSYIVSHHKAKQDYMCVFLLVSWP